MTRDLEVCLGMLSGPPEVLDLAGNLCPERHQGGPTGHPPTVEPAGSARGLELRDHTRMESRGGKPTGHPGAVMS